MELSERSPAAEEPEAKAEGDAEAKVLGEEPEEPKAAEEPGIEAEGEPGEVTTEIAAAGEPEGPARAAELAVRQSGTATVAITLPPVGSVRVQWDFRAENFRRSPAGGASA